MRTPEGLSRHKLHDPFSGLYLRQCSSPVFFHKNLSLATNQYKGGVRLGAHNSCPVAQTPGHNWRHSPPWAVGLCMGRANPTKLDNYLLWNTSGLCKLTVCARLNRAGAKPCLRIRDVTLNAINKSVACRCWSEPGGFVRQIKKKYQMWHRRLTQEINNAYLVGASTGRLVGEQMSDLLCLTFYWLNPTKLAFWTSPHVL